MNVGAATRAAPVVTPADLRLPGRTRRRGPGATVWPPDRLSLADSDPQGRRYGGGQGRARQGPGGSARTSVVDLGGLASDS